MPVPCAWPACRLPPPVSLSTPPRTDITLSMGRMRFAEGRTWRLRYRANSHAIIQSRGSATRTREPSHSCFCTALARILQSCQDQVATPLTSTVPSRQLGTLKMMNRNSGRPIDGRPSAACWLGLLCSHAQSWRVTRMCHATQSWALVRLARLDRPAATDPAIGLVLWVIALSGAQGRAMSCV